MENKQGKTVKDRLIEEIEYAESTEKAEHREVLALKAIGAADFAVDFGMITYKEWEQYIGRIFRLM